MKKTGEPKESRPQRGERNVNLLRRDVVKKEFVSATLVYASSLILRIYNEKKTRQNNLRNVMMCLLAL
jgi:hypothetical protein